MDCAKGQTKLEIEGATPLTELGGSKAAVTGGPDGVVVLRQALVIEASAYRSSGTFTTFLLSYSALTGSQEACWAS